MAAPPIRTVRDVIESAYRKTGDYEAGEAVSADDMENGLLVFQDLLSEWGGNEWLVSPLIQEALTLVVDQAVYTIGENGTPDLDTVRPARIITAFVRSGNTDYPVSIIGERAFARFPNKSTGRARPEYLWYNPTAPNGTINLYYTPSTADSLYISSVKQITDGATLTNDIMIDLGVPREQATALIYNVALDLLVEGGFDPPQLLFKRAEDTKNSIMALNAAIKAQPVEIEYATPNNTLDFSIYT